MFSSKKEDILKRRSNQDAEKEKEEDEKYAKKVEILYAFIRAVVSLSFSFIRIKKVCVCLCDSSFQRRSWSTAVLPVFDKVSVFFVRWFWAPFFEQVVFALGVLVVTSVSDCFQSLRGTFASSTKYLRQSSGQTLQRLPRSRLFTSSDIFLSSTKYFKMSM